MFEVLFNKLYSEIINPDPKRSFFIKELFKEVWIDWKFIENKINDFYHLDVNTIELINDKREKYFPEAKKVSWSYGDKIDPQIVANALKNNHSLVILNSSRFHYSLNRICNALESQGNKRSCDVHIYCGNEKSKSFFAHYDLADNFIIQQTGRTKWKVFKECASDMKEQKNIKDKKKLTLDYECILEPGELIYIPKERYHYAKPLEKRISLSFAVAHNVTPVNRNWYSLTD